MTSGGAAALGAGARVVIVGASLAGLRAAETLRAEGFSGQLTLVGDEEHEPYDRPPLSKQVLAGRLPIEHTALAHRHDLRAEWLLGVAAAELDLRDRSVRLADGRRLGFDRLLIATGTRARAWPEPSEAALDGVLTLRSRDDAARLRSRLTRRPNRVLVIGAGFTGSEVASACCELGLPVTVVERSRAPLDEAFGMAFGAFAAQVQRHHGVDLRCSVTVMALEGDGAGRLRRALLSDGDALDVDLAVVALGAVRNTEWVCGSGLAADGRGVVCDATCRVFDTDVAVTDDVFAAGDVARWPHPSYDGQLLAVEHWGNGIAQAATAARNMVCGPSERTAYKPVLAFWSNQFGLNIKSVGLPTVADQVAVAQGSVLDRRFVAVYGRGDRTVAAVAVNAPHWLDFYRGLVQAAGPFPPELHAAEGGDQLRCRPAGFPPPGEATHGAVAMLTGPGPCTPEHPTLPAPEQVAPGPPPDPRVPPCPPPL